MRSQSSCITARHFFPIESNRSMPRLFIGNLAAEGAVPVTGGSA